VVADGMSVSNTVRYPWSVKATSDSPDPLAVSQTSEQDVSVQVDVVREPGQRSVTLEGYVQVTAQGTRNLTVSGVQVRAALRHQAIKTMLRQAESPWLGPTA